MAEEYDFNDKTHGDVVSDTFCVLPWIHLNTWPNGNVYPCCLTDWREDIGNLKDATLEQLWNGGKMKELRKYMLEGKKHDNCRKCFQQEDNGLDSTRTSSNRHFKKHIPDITKNTLKNGHNNDFKLIYWDFRFSNLCNMKCRMCGSFLSSKWYEDDIKIFGGSELDRALINVNDYSKKDIQLYLEEFMDDVEEIYFAGGESLIIDEHYEILEYAIKNGFAENLEIRYNSNGVEWREDLFELWSNFKKVRFHYSVDSIFKMNEYIRYPSKWERTEEVFHILDNETTDNVEVTVACAVNALNIFYIPDFIRWKLTQKFKKINMWPFGAGGINHHFVYWPGHINVKVLPKWFKEECRKKYQDFYPWWKENHHLGIPSWHKVDYADWIKAEYGLKRLEGMLSFMESEDWSIRLTELQEYLELCDTQRNTNFYETFPEMKDIFKDV